MIIIRILLIVGGVVAVMIGAQLPWGEVETELGSEPLNFFLDIGAIGTILSVIGIALGGLSLSDRLSERAVGALLLIFGLGIATGAGFLMTLIDRDHLELDPAFEEFVPVEAVVLGPGGFVAASGGLVLALAGLLFMVTPPAPGPPIPAGGGPGEVPAGWYPISGRPHVVAYWNGTRWTHERENSEPRREPPGMIGHR